MIKSGLARNKGRKVGQKRALRPQDVWMIRGRLRAEGHKRDLALLNLAIDSKLSAYDLGALQVKDVCHHRVHRSSANSEGASQRSGEAPPGRVRSRANVVLQRTRNRPTWDTASRLQGRCLSIPSRSGYSDPPCRNCRCVRATGGLVESQSATAAD
jgi:hypothetical protein